MRKVEREGERESRGHGMRVCGFNVYSGQIVLDKGQCFTVEIGEEISV